jgi:hypothetical protein
MSRQTKWLNRDGNLLVSCSSHCRLFPELLDLSLFQRKAEDSGRYHLEQFDEGRRSTYLYRHISAPLLEPSSNVLTLKSLSLSATSLSNRVAELVFMSEWSGWVAEKSANQTTGVRSALVWMRKPCRAPWFRMRGREKKNKSTRRCGKRNSWRNAREELSSYSSVRDADSTSNCCSLIRMLKQGRE